ncbi:hypothetical protein D3C85_1651270 [compost metagenome]
MPSVLTISDSSTPWTCTLVPEYSGDTVWVESWTATTAMSALAAVEEDLAMDSLTMIPPVSRPLLSFCVNKVTKWS